MLLGQVVLRGGSQLVAPLLFLPPLFLLWSLLAVLAGWLVLLRQGPIKVFYFLDPMSSCPQSTVAVGSAPPPFIPAAPPPPTHTFLALVSSNCNHWFVGHAQICPSKESCCLVPNTSFPQSRDSVGSPPITPAPSHLLVWSLPTIPDV